MDRDALFELVEAERHRLCDRLDELTPEQWDAASSCVGWRVRDVLGHLVSLQDLPTRRLVLGVFTMGQFHRRVDRFARDYGAREPAELLERCRRLAGGRAAPPVLGPIAPLTDIVVHGLDITRPLGLPPAASDEAVREVIEVCSRGLPTFVPRRLVRGLSFAATDLDWSAGSGPTVLGAWADLLSAMNGRTVEVSSLAGDGAAEFADRRHR